MVFSMLWVGLLGSGAAAGTSNCEPSVPVGPLGEGP